ncbi:leucine-rich repeat and IQ domain-containing protein 3 [Ochotona princeps]|uniref:leucine-rich repeat and IQ domain-containing protein 3 n=1 Tax=Ochotona princeps TaxID=9978 RepID=UPI002714998A|nr:leucine-rich repeat and IQ domain-containing protein 3 [Ochotona princeps]
MFHGTVTEELTSHEEWSHYNDNIIEDQKDFVFVKFNGLHLKSMENLQSCISLKVCIFSNNFITDINPLQSCTKLIKLDLHGNQIKILPDAKFWSGMKSLKLLYLHDNGFTKLKNACELSACSSLVALTMFDCPVSLKKGYRHVLVNSIWSLKALDHYLISDEEIIQNWHLPERFKTFSHQLYFNFCPPLKKGTTYEEEINNIKYTISKINKILAHTSPVLIVQRWIRGFLVRKSLSHLFLHKRHHPKITKEHEAKWIYITEVHDDKLYRDVVYQTEADIKGSLDHWKYNMDSSIFSKWSSEHRELVFPFLYGLKKDIALKSKKPRHLIQRVQKEPEDETDEEFEPNFRVSVLKVPIHRSDSLKCAVLLKEMKQFSFPAYVKPFSTTYPKPVIRKETVLEKNLRKEFFETCGFSINHKAVNDIDKYFTNQKKQEHHQEKAAAVAMAKASQKRVVLAVRENRNKKNYATKKLREKDKEMLQIGLQQHCQSRFNYIANVRGRRSLFLEEKQRKAAERLLVQNLNNERNLLIKGLIKVDRIKKIEAMQREKRLISMRKLQEEKLQRDLRKRVKEFRSEEIHKRHCEEKFVLDMISFQKACERLQDAKTKVAIVKTNIGFPHETTT